jgi:cytoskeletal protein RodZ
VNDPGSPDNTERLAAFGRWLARERELRGLARDEVSRRIKLAPGVVEALESGEEARMPPRAYALGWLRAYASAVGLDPSEVALRYEEAIGPAQGPGSRRRTGTSSRVIVAVVLALAVAGAGLWALLRS